MSTISINTDHTHCSLGAFYCFCWLFFFCLFEWIHFLCGTSKGHLVFDPCHRVHRKQRCPPGAGPASLPRRQMTQPCQPCKAARKLSYINNSVHSRPCFDWLAGRPALGRMTHGHFISQPLSSSPGSPSVTLHLHRRGDKEREREGRRRGSCWAASGDVAMSLRLHTHTHTGFLPSRGQTQSMHIWEKGNGGHWFGRWWEKLLSTSSNLISSWMDPKCPFRPWGTYLVLMAECMKIIRGVAKTLDHEIELLHKNPYNFVLWFRKLLY